MTLEPSADAMERMELNDGGGGGDMMMQEDDNHESNDDDDDDNTNTTDDDDDEEMPDLVETTTTKAPKGSDNDDNDDNSEDDDDDVGGIVSSTEKADELLLQAATLKEEGNVHFKEGDLDQAARSYRRGCKALQKLNQNNTGDEQVKSLLLALRTNLSMVSFKQKKYKLSCDIATKALEIDSTNVKALYRRAVALRQLGSNLEAARDDLRQAVKIDPSNASCRKELAAIKKELELSKENQKKALAKAFQKSTSSFLYDDKEAEEKRKQEEEQRKKMEAEELQKKRKEEWELECVNRMANDKPAISFEEWEKERKEKEKQQEEKRQKEEQQRKEEQRKLRQAAKSEQQKKKKDDSDDEDDELTEQELAMMRGYKKTKDGRTTSYFTRELSEEERKALGDTAPKKLNDVSSTGPIPLKSINEQGGGGGGVSRPSAWNQAGTWEEKDTTSWCSSQLQKRLEEASVTSSKLDADIVSVEELTGDASVALAGGKKRYIFDMHARLKYEVKDPEKDETVASGVVRLPDICSTSHNEELEVTFDGWTKAPRKDIEASVDETRRKLADDLRVKVQCFVQDFNEMY